MEAPKNRKHRRTIYPRRTPSGYPLAERLAARIEAVRAEQEAGTNPLGPTSDELLAYTDNIRLRYEHLPKGPPRKGADNHLNLIRFIHQAANALQKEEPFRACRNGEVAVLVGSTEKLELEGTLSRLDRLRRAWAQNQTALGYTIRNAGEQIAGKKRAIAMIEAALSRHHQPGQPLGTGCLAADR